MRATMVAVITIMGMATASTADISQVSTQPVNANSTAVNSSADINKIENFRPLFEERERLIERQRDLEKEIEDLSAKLKDAGPEEILQQNMASANADLKTAQAATPPDPGKVATIQNYLAAAQAKLQTVLGGPASLQSKKTEYERNTQKLFALEQRIASLFDDTRDINRFHLGVTVTFGILVLVVIAGFYVIAWYKQGVATAIFAGEMGMQFVTLFLVVIAIILFGIMGTLEGRELAALLGGLSGYILGRASGASRHPSSEGNGTQSL